jgi:hypothetical protein
VPCIATKERISPQGKHIGYHHSFASCGRMSAKNFAWPALLVLRQQLTARPTLSTVSSRLSLVLVWNEIV